MKKTSTLVVIALGLFVGTSARAQVNIPVNNVSLEYPSGPIVTLSVGGTVENVIDTPFLIAGQQARSRSWLCMDPLQRIYYNGSGLPSSTQIRYGSTNPSDFDLWNPSAPGLSTARVQALADLFTAYWPASDSATTNGALQLAVWEITNEFNGNGFNLSTGQVLAYNNTALVNQAQAMLDSLSTVGIQGRGNVGSLNFLIDGTIVIDDRTTLVQDLVGWNPLQLTTPVPEPSTYGLGAVLCLGLVTAIRRRRARA